MECLKIQKLTYTIRFQNTGNAAAINIYILDSLSSYLDLNSVKVIGQSHEPMLTEVLPGNVLKFGFNKIYLPDSNSNEPESHGYIIFEVKPKSSLSDGTKIENTTAIFFDFNEPIITNTVFNTITHFIPQIDTAITKNNHTTLTASAAAATYQWLDCDNGFTPIPGETGKSFTATANGTYAVIITENGCTDTSACVTITKVGIEQNLFADQLEVYPNPTSGKVLLEFSQTQAQINVEIKNTIGQLVQEASFENSKSANLEIDAPAGIYFVTIRNKKGEWAVVKVVKE